jgi:drug/metabolite transporter (DMT)-like permease
MYHYLIGFSLLKTIRPYIRKHILDGLSTHEFLVVNTLCISLLVLAYFLFLCVRDPKHPWTSLASMKKLSLTQWAAIILLAALTVGSTILFVEFERRYSTPVVSNLLTRVLGIVLLVGVGIFVYEEKYTYLQIVGMVVAIVGMALVIAGGDAKSEGLLPKTIKRGGST